MWFPDSVCHYQRLVDQPEPLLQVWNPLGKDRTVILGRKLEFSLSGIAPWFWIHRCYGPVMITQLPRSQGLKFCHWHFNLCPNCFICHIATCALRPKQRGWLEAIILMAKVKKVMKFHWASSGKGSYLWTHLKAITTFSLKSYNYTLKTNTFLQ